MSDETETEVIASFKYVLTTSFKYDFKGDRQDAAFIELHAPTSRHSRECAALKQAFFGSAAGIGGDEPKSKKDKEDVSITGQEVIAMLAMSPAVELADVMDTGISLFTNKGVALVDGEVNLNKQLLERMRQDDLEAMLGEYLVNFTLASYLAQMKT